MVKQLPVNFAKILSTSSDIVWFFLCRIRYDITRGAKGSPRMGIYLQCGFTFNFGMPCQGTSYTAKYAVFVDYQTLPTFVLCHIKYTKVFAAFLV